MKINSINPGLSFGMFNRNAAEKYLKEASDVNEAKKQICKAGANKDYHVWLKDNGMYYVYKDHFEIGIPDRSTRYSDTKDPKIAAENADILMQGRYNYIAGLWKLESPGCRSNAIYLVTTDK